MKELLDVFASVTPSGLPSKPAPADVDPSAVVDPRRLRFRGLFFAEEDQELAPVEDLPPLRPLPAEAPEALGLPAIFLTSPSRADARRGLVADVVDQVLAKLKGD